MTDRPRVESDHEQHTVLLLDKILALLPECRALAGQMETAPTDEPEFAAAERITYGTLARTIEQGLVTSLEAADGLRRLSE